MRAVSDEPVDRAEDAPILIGSTGAKPEEGVPPLLSPARKRAGAAPWLAACAAVLLIVIAGVLLSPFWAPALMPVLPWGERAAATQQQLAGLAAQVHAIEQRPAPHTVDLAPLQSAQTALAQHVERLGASVAELRQNETTAAGVGQSLDQLAKRLDASAAQSASRVAADAADVGKMQQHLAELSSRAADHAARLTQLEHQVQAQSGAGRGDLVTLVALLQMREAIEDGRPFPAAYHAVEALAHGDPGLAAAARPLAGAAHDGVASEAELRRRLAALSAQISAPNPVSAKSASWWAQALDRMSRLVTIRRIDAAANIGPAATVEAARQAMSRGDLAAAVAALQQLSGADADAARRWLKDADARLAAEAALTRLQDLLVTRPGALPAPPSAPAMVPAPNKPAPAPSPAAPRAPS